MSSNESKANPADLVKGSMYEIVSNPGKGIKLKYIEQRGSYRFDRNGHDNWPVFLTHQHGNTYNVLEHRIHDGSFPNEGVKIDIEYDEDASLELAARDNIQGEARRRGRRGGRRSKKRKRKSTKKKRRRKRKRTKKKRRRRRR